MLPKGLATPWEQMQDPFWGCHLSCHLRRTAVDSILPDYAEFRSLSHFPLRRDQSCRFRIHLLLVSVYVVVWESVPDVAVMVTTAVCGFEVPLPQAVKLNSARPNSSAAVALKR